MAYADPQSTHNPTTGQIIPASWGDIVRDDLEYLARNFPHCSIKETTAQSIASGSASYTALTSNEENSDIGGMHSTVTNTSRITIPAGEGGLYTLTATVTFDANTTGVRAVGFGKNGAQPTYSAATATPAPSGFGTSLSAATSLVLAAGDYVELMVFQTSGAGLNCTMNDFSVAWRAVA